MMQECSDVYAKTHPVQRGQSLQGCAFGCCIALLARRASRPGTVAKYLGITVQGPGDFQAVLVFFLAKNMPKRVFFGGPMME